MNKMIWCERCQEEVQPEVIQKDETYNYKGEKIKVTANVAVCPRCRAELPDEELDGAVMHEVQKIYMNRMGLTFEEIRNIRLGFGLSMELLAKILGWSKSTIVRYESGKVPSSSHIAILKRLKENPEELENYYKQSTQKFSEKEEEKVKKAFGEMDSEVIERNLTEALKRYYHDYEKTINSGFATFSIEKVIQMILFFAQDGINKTVLLKHLFYADFLNFKRSLISITGLSYVKFKHGPVPMKYNLLLETLQETGYIEIQEEYFEDFTRITIKSIQPFERDLFEDHELEVLNQVKESFKGYSSKKISDFSHEEDAWKYTDTNHIIPYDLAENLQLD